MKDSYLEVLVPSRDQARYAVVVPDDATEVEWEWALDEFSLNFSLTFTPSGAGGTACAVQNLEGYQANSGPVTGRFEAPGPGSLVFTFNNSFSLMRSKKVILRVLPEH